MKGRPWASLFYWPRPRLSASSTDKLDTMVRLLFWIALIAAAFWLWRKFKASQQSHPEAKLDAPLKMVRCAHCGVHLPNDRALQQGNEWYCSQAHLQQGPGRQG